MRDLHEGGGNCLKYLERGWNRKEGSGHKDFKKGGKLGQGVGALKGVLCGKHNAKYRPEFGTLVFFLGTGLNFVF